MQVSPCHRLWLHLRPLTLVLLLVVVCGRFGAGEGIELKIKPEDSSFTRAMGSSFVFTCEISGADRDSATNYDLKWFRNSLEITDKTASRMYVEDEGAVFRKLYITGFEEEDVGIYKCTGMIEGTVWEKSTNVYLFNDITFDHAPEVQHPAIYTDAVIECRVSGKPWPEVSWRSNGYRILTGGRYKIVGEGLRIRNITVKDDGLYICRAEVEADGRYGEQKITVAVHTAPDSPQSVNVTECLPNSIVLQMEPPVDDDGEKVRGYLVEYYKFVGEQVPEYSEIPSNVLEVLDSNTMTIENLKPNTTYKIRVKAKNDVGVSSPKELTVMTKSVQKPSPIQITSESKAEAGRSYTIAWKKPITGGLPIKEYEFLFRTVSVAEDGSGGKKFGEWQRHTRPDDVNKPMLTYHLSGLTASTTYDLQVRARNDLGWSDAAEFQYETREDSPSEIAAVQASVNPGAIVAIVVVIFVVLLVVVDVSCYFINHCGVTMCICVHLCGRSSAFTKEKAMEEGERQCLKSDDEKETQKEKEELKEALKEGIESEKEKEKDSTDDVKVVSGTKEEKTEKAPAV